MESRNPTSDLLTESWEIPNCTPVFALITGLLQGGMKIRILKQQKRRVSMLVNTDREGRWNPEVATVCIQNVFIALEFETVYCSVGTDAMSNEEIIPYSLLLL